MEFSIYEPLFTEYEYNGEVYPVDMSFDNILLLSDLSRDEELDNEEKVDIGLVMLFGDSLEGLEFEEQVEIFTSVLKIIFPPVEDTAEYDILGNKMPSRNGDGEEDEPMYDIKQDANYIFASFKQVYDMDLVEERGKLHWQKFNSLLAGLPKGCKFMEVLEIRGKEEPTGKGTQKEREHIRKMKKKYALKKNTDEEAK